MREWSARHAYVIAARGRLRRQTPRGMALSKWAGIKARAGNADGKHPAYADVELRMTRQEFVDWFIAEASQWNATYPGVKPTVDRRDSRGHYELGNLQLASLSDNSRRQRWRPNLDAPDGMLWCGRCRQHKPREAFAKCARIWTGRQSHCKACNREERAR